MAFSFSSNAINAQGSYTTTSASCGKCGGSVSSNSKVGDRCPHCGVTWGRENSRTTSRTTTNTSISDYGNSDSYKTVLKNSNLRITPSINGDKLGVIPANSRVNILDYNSEWYKVSYTGSFVDDFITDTYYGWVSKTNFTESHFISNTNQTLKANDCWDIGSTKQKVRIIEGTPDKVSKFLNTESWYYGVSFKSITFENGVVTEYNNKPMPGMFGSKGESRFNICN